MAVEKTEHDDAAPASPTDAAVVDTAAEKPDLEALAVAEALGTAATDDGDETPAKPATEAPKPAGSDTGAPAEIAKPADTAAKPADEAAKDPLDEADDAKNYKGRTGERVEALRKSGLEWREKATEAEKANELMQADVKNWNGYVALVQDSGGTAEDLGMAMATIRAVIKGTPDERQTAFKVVEALRTTLADQLGIALPDMDYLKDHADLRKQVEEGELTDAAARELAANRRFRDRSTADTQARADADKARQTQDRADADSLAAHQRIAQETSDLAAAYLKRDGQDIFNLRASYATRQINAMRTAKVDVSPERGKELFQQLYSSEDANTLVAATKVGQQRNTSGARPIMGSRQGGNGGARAAPQTEEEAVLAALRGED